MMPAWRDHYDSWHDHGTITMFCITIYETETLCQVFLNYLTHQSFHHLDGVELSLFSTAGLRRSVSLKIETNARKRKVDFSATPSRSERFSEIFSFEKISITEMLPCYRKSLYALQ